MHTTTWVDLKGIMLCLKKNFLKVDIPYDFLYIRFEVIKLQNWTTDQ